ncbi:unnamed protein product [Lota lota]
MLLSFASTPRRAMSSGVAQLPDLPRGLFSPARNARHDTSSLSDPRHSCAAACDEAAGGAGKTRAKALSVSRGLRFHGLTPGGSMD